jgi:hypothetical protein
LNTLSSIFFHGSALHSSINAGLVVVITYELLMTPLLSK